MRAVVQRVKESRAKIDEEIIGEINQGLLVLLAVHKDDTEKDIVWMAKKIAQLRIFGDEDCKMNKSVKDTGGEILIVSQFTLYGDCGRGNRPSFITSARPEKAKEFYEKFLEQIRSAGIKVATGKFQEHMELELINDGPTTIIIDSHQ
ncbi:MAG: D-aminoacyl-tRNA deacylase [Patescibacteria group bacterium]|jgi:D-tyrosyl-tRNA(Tyr) deacylase